MGSYGQRCNPGTRYERASKGMVSAVHEVAMSRTTIHFVAIATRSHLAQAAVLAQSLHRVHPDVPRTLFLVEPTIEPCDTDSGWSIRLASQLPLPEPRRFMFQYTPFQLCCALKPFALEAVMPESQKGGGGLSRYRPLCHGSFLGCRGTSVGHRRHRADAPS